jgi:hypothetical protein
MEKVLRWVVYYDDGSWVPWHAVGGDLGQLPKVGVITIRQEVMRGVGQFPDTIHINGFDYYWITPEDGLWGGSDLFGAFDYLTRSGYKVLLFGRTIAAQRFQEICAAARADTWDDLAP